MLTLVVAITVDATVLRDGRAWVPAPVPPLGYGAARVLAFTNLLRAGEPYVKPRRYPRGKGVRGSMRAYRCPSGCYAAYEAGRLHHLPWQYAFSLTGDRCLDVLNLLPEITGVPSDRVQVFWLVTVSDHEAARSPKTWNPATSKPHVHGCIGGGVKYEWLVSLLRSLDPSAVIKRMTHPFGWLHYIHSQEKAIPARDGNPRDISGMLRHSRDVFSYCHALLVPPYHSLNLEGISQFFRTAVRAYRRRSTRRVRETRRAGGLARFSSMSTAEKSALGRAGAAGRWRR